MEDTRMRHVRRYPTVTDPETGRVYPIPAGGSDAGGDGGDAAGDGDGTDDTTDGDDGDDDTDGDDDAGRAGGPEALRADLARERERRKAERDRRRAAEQELEALRRGNESDVERAQREAREAALGPAMRALRSTAVESAASTLGFRDVQDAIRAVDLDAIDVDEDTLDVDRAAAKALVEELAKAKPYLLTDDGQRRLGGSGTARGGADTTAGNGSSTTSTPQDSFMAALRGARGR